MRCLAFVTGFTLLAAPLAGQEPGPVSMQDVLAAIEQLRQAFDLADQRVREAVEVPHPLPEDREQGLDAAAEALDQLVQEMDAVLEILPDPPDSGGSGSSGQNQPKPQPEGGQGSDSQRTEPGPSEGQNGKVPPPSGPPLVGQPPANYGRWGILPPRLQEALQNSSGTEVPARYRRWLEEYQRRGQRPR